MRIRYWSSDVCSSDLRAVDALDGVLGVGGGAHQLDHRKLRNGEALRSAFDDQRRDDGEGKRNLDDELGAATLDRGQLDGARSEEHTSELQSLMRNSYAVFCLTKKIQSQNKTSNSDTNTKQHKT